MYYIFTICSSGGKNKDNLHFLVIVIAKAMNVGD